MSLSRADIVGAKILTILESNGPMTSVKICNRLEESILIVTASCSKLFAQKRIKKLNDGYRPILWGVAHDTTGPELSKVWPMPVEFPPVASEAAVRKNKLEI